MAISNAADIANLALAKVGSKAFLTDPDFDEEGTEAELMRLTYETTRNGLLQQFDWPFATLHSALAQVAGATRTGWGYVYALPTNCLSPRGIWSGDRNAPVDMQVPWVIQANDAGDDVVLLCDRSAAELVYICQFTNVAKYPPLFTRALVWALAGELALSLAVKPQLYAGIQQQAALALAQAKNAALTEQKADEPPRASLLRARE